MKKFALSLVAVAACAGAFRAYESYQQSGESDALLAENVEALSDSEPSPMKCTRPKVCGSCYDSKNDFKGVWISEVEVYYVYPGSPIRCDHAIVQGCPSGCHKG